MSGKFDIQKIIDDVKSIVTPAPIPEANKDDPVGYHLSELGRLTKDLAENHTKQADTLAKVNAILGGLYQELGKVAKPKTAPVAEASTAEDPKVEESSKTE